MNGSKTYKVRGVSADMERQHNEKGSKGWVSLPKMFKRKKRKIQRAIGRVVVFMFEILISLIPAGIVSLWAMPAAYRYRGYFAVGGEWILVLLVFGISFVGISDLFDGWVEKERSRIR